MKISEVVSLETISYDIQADSKYDLLEKMVELASKSGKVTDFHDAKKEIFEREKIMSTGIGKGIALPHAKTQAVLESVASFAVLDKPIDYDALDGNPVNIVFLLIGRENNVGIHLRLLSKISKILSNDFYKDELIAIKSPAELLKFFDKVEEQMV